MGSLRLASRASRCRAGRAAAFSVNTELSIFHLPAIRSTGLCKRSSNGSSPSIQKTTCSAWSKELSSPLTCHGSKVHTVFGKFGNSGKAMESFGPSRMGSEVQAASLSSSASSANAFTPEDVLQFWFREVDPENNIYVSKNWFMGGPDFDKEIEVKFKQYVELAAAGVLDGWKSSARGRLALVIVLDQFPRNIYRKSPMAYAHDEMARKITIESIEQGLDRELTPPERWFLYLPLMHSENLADHDIADRVFKKLVDENTDNEHLHEVLSGNYDFELKHRAVLEQFGRYPSRNSDLGRKSTPEEEEHLLKGASW